MISNNSDLYYDIESLQQYIQRLKPSDPFKQAILLLTNNLKISIPNDQKIDTLCKFVQIIIPFIQSVINIQPNASMTIENFYQLIAQKMNIINNYQNKYQEHFGSPGVQTNYSFLDNVNVSITYVDKIHQDLKTKFIEHFGPSVVQRNSSFLDNVRNYTTNIDNIHQHLYNKFQGYFGAYGTQNKISFSENVNNYITNIDNINKKLQEKFIEHFGPPAVQQNFSFSENVSNYIGNVDQVVIQTKNISNLLSGESNPQIYFIPRIQQIFEGLKIIDQLFKSAEKPYSPVQPVNAPMNRSQSKSASYTPTQNSQILPLVQRVQAYKINLNSNIASLALKIGFSDVSSNSVKESKLLDEFKFLNEFKLLEEIQKKIQNIQKEYERRIAFLKESYYDES